MSKETVLNKNAFLVSETDVKGIIKFAAFKSLWDTVQKGEIWTGYVKNATKDGGYYWVFATVYPFESCDGSKGYLSCRRKPSKIEIEKAEKLYEEMRRNERN